MHAEVSIPFRGGGDCKFGCFDRGLSFGFSFVSIPFRGGGDCKSPGFGPDGRSRSWPLEFQSPFGVGAIASTPTPWPTSTPRPRRFNPLSGWGRLQADHHKGREFVIELCGFNPLSGWGRLQGEFTTTNLNAGLPTFQSPFGVGAIARSVLYPCSMTLRPSFNPLSGWGRLQAHNFSHPAYLGAYVVSIPFRGGGDCKGTGRLRLYAEAAHKFQSPFGVGAIASSACWRCGERASSPSSFNPLSGWGRLQVLLNVRECLVHQKRRFNPLSGWGRLQGRCPHGRR